MAQCRYHTSPLNEGGQNEGAQTQGLTMCDCVNNTWVIKISTQVKFGQTGDCCVFVNTELQIMLNF